MAEEDQEGVEEAHAVEEEVVVAIVEGVVGDIVAEEIAVAVLAEEPQVLGEDPPTEAATADVVAEVVPTDRVEVEDAAVVVAEVVVGEVDVAVATPAYPPTQMHN